MVKEKSVDKVFEIVLENGRHFEFNSGYEIWKRMMTQRNRWQFYDGDDNKVTDYSTWIQNRNSKKKK